MKYIFYCPDIYSARRIRFYFPDSKKIFITDPECVQEMLSPGSNKYSYKKVTCFRGKSNEQCERKRIIFGKRETLSTEKDK